MSLFACPGVGNRPPGKNKFANLQGCAGGLGGGGNHALHPRGTLLFGLYGYEPIH